MDQNTKRDRAQKMKRDKRSKDIKRAHELPSKSDTKPACVIAPQVVLTNAQRNDVATEKTTRSKETAEETEDVTRFANLKRETDEINAINKSFSKRQITSNWSKYETALPPEDDDVISKGADFESLLGAPISEGGHFKFKSEQMWAPNSLQYSDIFSLNIKHLARSLSCIPFYEQVSLPQQLFSQEELQQMDNEAKQHLDRLKTSPEELLVDNFYNMLMLSLADSPPKETIDKKVNLKIESVDDTSKEGGGIQDLYAGDQTATQGSQCVEDPNHHKSTVEDINLSASRKEEHCVEDATNRKSTIKDINLSPSRKEEQCEASNEENIMKPVPAVSLPQRSSKSKPRGIVKNIQLSQEATVPEKVASKEIGLDAPLGDSKDSQVVSKSEDDELDFLLTLKTPVSGPKYSGKGATEPAAAPVIDDIPGGDLGAPSLLSSAEKKEDLEDWLDSMLDD